MAIPSFPARRLLIAGFLVAAGAFPLVSAHPQAQPDAVLAQCHPGEENDVFTSVCTPYLVPNSPSGLTATAANPDVPEIQGIPCIGSAVGACLGLAENAEAAGPQAVPRSVISASP